MSRRHFLQNGAALAAASALSPTAFAQSEGGSSAPIRFIVGIGPGSGGDSVTRFVADRFRIVTGQPTVTENKTGGDQIPAVLDLLKSPADGRTILYITPTPMLINTLLQKDLPYKQEDLRPIAMSTRAMAVMLTGNDSRFKTFQDVVTEMKAKPGTIALANYGHHYRLGGVALEKVVGGSFNHVNYKGAAQANTDLISGVVDLHLTDVGAVMPLIKSGKLRPLAVTGTNRHALLPDVPTIIERGYPTYTLYVWTGYAVNARTPERIVQKLEADMLTVLRQPEFADYAVQQSGAELSVATGKQFQDAIAADTTRILAVLK